MRKRRNGENALFGVSSTYLAIAYLGPLLIEENCAYITLQLSVLKYISIVELYRTKPGNI